MKLSLPHGGCVAVCDGRKALFLRNEGDAEVLSLQVETVEEAPANDKTAEQGTDRPGRLQTAAGPASAVEATDWHDRAEQAFAQHVAKVLLQLHEADPHRRFALVAPPRTLAVLRDALGGRLGAALVAERDKDLTRHPVSEIERLLSSN